MPGFSATDRTFFLGNPGDPSSALAVANFGDNKIYLLQQGVVEKQGRWYSDDDPNGDREGYAYTEEIVLPQPLTSLQEFRKQAREAIRGGKTWKLLPDELTANVLWIGDQEDAVVWSWAPEGEGSSSFFATPKDDPSKARQKINGSKLALEKLDADVFAIPPGNADESVTKAFFTQVEERSKRLKVNRGSQAAKSDLSEAVGKVSIAAYGNPNPTSHLKRIGELRQQLQTPPRAWAPLTQQPPADGPASDPDRTGKIPAEVIANVDRQRGPTSGPVGFQPRQDPPTTQFRLPVPPPASRTPLPPVPPAVRPPQFPSDPPTLGIPAQPVAAPRPGPPASPPPPANYAPQGQPWPPRNNNPQSPPPRFPQNPQPRQPMPPNGWPPPRPGGANQPLPPQVPPPPRQQVAPGWGPGGPGPVIPPNPYGQWQPGPPVQPPQQPVRKRRFWPFGGNKRRGASQPGAPDPRQQPQNGPHPNPNQPGRGRW